MTEFVGIVVALICGAGLAVWVTGRLDKMDEQRYLNRRKQIYEACRKTREDCDT